MWRLCAFFVSLTACGIGFQSGDADGGGAPFGGNGGGETTGGGATTSSAGGGATTTGPGGSASSSGGAGEGGGPPSCVPGLEVPASIADCIRHLAPDPDDCASLSSYEGSGEMDVDESADSTAGNIARAYLRFDLPNGAQGATGFTLRLTNTGTGGDANSPGSGAVFRVESFVRPDLFSGPPARVSQDALAGDQGAVSDGEVVDWPLPAGVVDAGSLYLEIAGTDANGVRYWNNAGDAPPELIVRCD